MWTKWKKINAESNKFFLIIRIIFPLLVTFSFFLNHWTEHPVEHSSSLYHSIFPICQILFPTALWNRNALHTAEDAGFSQWIQCKSHPDPLVLYIFISNNHKTSSYYIGCSKFLNFWINLFYLKLLLIYFKF